MRVIPLFKSHFSIGKSILTLNESSAGEEYADSIFEIAKEGGLKELFLVEDCMTSFMKADKACKKLGMQLRFGLRLNCYSDPSLQSETSHKVIVFAKNTNGIKTLYHIHKEAFSGDAGISDEKLAEFINDDINIAIPFYDSFVANNTLFMKKCVPNFLKNPNVFFFVEDNKLPFDSIIRNAIMTIAGDSPIVFAKSIYYKKREDFLALQTYKLICNRKFGKQATLDNPNLDHFASYEFCWESYLEQCKANS